MVGSTIAAGTDAGANFGEDRWTMDGFDSALTGVTAAFFKEDGLDRGAN